MTTTYGYFDDDNREYVITTPYTPTKWINYVGTLDFGGLVDHTGGLLICQADPALNRLTKYIPQLPDSDFKGGTLYLRLPEGGGYRVFSPYVVPTLDAYDRFECHVGMGYTRLVSKMFGLCTEATFFVPRGERRLLTDIRITNVSDAPLTVEAVPVVEYTHFDALKQFTNADWVPQTMQSRALRDGEQTVLVQCAVMKRGVAENYFTASRPAASFETDRARFLGRHGWAAPDALQRASLSSYEALRGDNIAALLIPLGALAPGETARLVTQLGQVPDAAAALPDIRRYFDPATADAAFAMQKAFWTNYLAALQVETPDPGMNSMLNVHHPRQCHTTKNWSRYLSLYQLGLGSRGIGVRDSSQDVMGVLAHIPDEGQALIKQIMHFQRLDGSAWHLFYPLIMVGSYGETRDDPDRPQYYSDDHLWPALATCAYLKETGDLAFLDELVPYDDKDRDGQPLETGTVLDHMRRAAAFTRQHIGQHGLPLAGWADWNDTINLRTGAESLFTAHLYGWVLREMIALFEHLGQADEAAHYRAWYDEMRERVNTHGWDGDWYLRYFDCDGTPLGSHQNRHGQIYTNAQSWPVLSGFAPPDRARTALDSVYERLNTPKGIKLSTPGFDGFDPVVGGISTYPPGAKENGGIFLHANPWVMIAETMLGNGARAYAYYTQINPANKNEHIDEYEIEPYVYAQNILGDEHPQFGLGRNSWLSGTASWVYQAATQYILGVRPTYAGLQVDPCPPPEWDGFRMRRRFRGATYHITVSNPDGVSRGVRSVTVDGEAIEGDVLPVFTDGGDHTVEVVMG